MALKDLSYKNIAEVDGGSVEVAVDRAIRLAVIDCNDRPHLKTARTVTLTISLQPVPEPQGNMMSYAGARFDVSMKIPGRSTALLPMKMTPAGFLGFQPDAPDNPNQETFDYDGDDKNDGPET